MRTPFQVLIIPFRLTDEKYEYAALKREDLGVWQAVAGGGENNETPLQAARREAMEELQLPKLPPLVLLDTKASIPKCHFRDSCNWSSDTFVITEFAFGVDCTGQTIDISHEHTEIKWGSELETRDLYYWDSNKTALWELSTRLIQHRITYT